MRKHKILFDTKEVNEARYWDYEKENVLPRITINRASEVMVSPAGSDRWFVISPESLLAMISIITHKSGILRGYTVKQSNVTDEIVQVEVCFDE